MAKDNKSKITEDRTMYENLCVPSHLERTDYMSDTYAAVVTINDTKQFSQVTHIKMPFDKSREKAVMEYYDISKDGMKNLYDSLGFCVTNQVRVCAYLRSKGVSSVLTYIKRAVFDSPGKGKEVYFVTEHLRPMIDVYFNGSTSYTNIFNFAVRTAKLIKDVHQMGENPVTIRVIDPEQIFVADDGKFVFGCFHYAYMSGSKNKPLPIFETAPLHIDGRVTTGSVGDIGTDMFSLASILWSLLNGDGFDKPTPTGTPPKYATPEMVSVLELGLAGDPEMFPQFRKRLGEIFRSVKAEASDLEIPVPIAERCIKTPTYPFDEGSVEMLEVPVYEEHNSPVDEIIMPVLPEIGNIIHVTPEVEEAPGFEEPPVVEEIPVQEEPVVAETTPVQPEPVVPAAITEEEEDLGTFKASVLDTAEYVEKTESAAEIDVDSLESAMDFNFTYTKPVFFLRQLVVTAAILAIIAAILYLSVKMHLISFW